MLNVTRPTAPSCTPTVLLTIVASVRRPFRILPTQVSLNSQSVRFGDKAIE